MQQSENVNIVRARQLTCALNNLIDFLSKEYDVNGGGCCYVAYIIAQELEKLGFKYTVVFCDWRGWYKNSRLKVRKDIKGRNKSSYGVGPKTCNHYCIRIQGCEKLINGSNPRYKHTEVSYLNSKDLGWIYNRGYWNDIYDPDNNEFIKKHIHLIFKNYEKVWNQE